MARETELALRGDSGAFGGIPANTNILLISCSFWLSMRHTNWGTPALSDAVINQAKALLREGRTAEAEQVCRRVLADNPNHLELNIFLGSLCMESGRSAEAEQVFGRALRANPHALAAIFGRAAALQSLLRHSEAAELLEVAVQNHPQSATAWYNRGAVRMSMGQHAAAEADFTRALALQPNSAKLLESRGTARAFQGLESANAAIQDLQSALAVNPRNPDSWHMLGRSFLALGQTGEALACWQRALGIAPQHLQSLLDRGFVLNAVQQHADALADFDRVIPVSRDHPAAWQGRGIALASLNHVQPAIESFSEALRINASDALSLFNRAVMLSAEKRFVDAAADLEALLRLAPQYPLARGLLLNARLQLCDWQDLDQQRHEITKALDRGIRVIHPFVHLLISDSPAEQLSSARLQGAEAHPASAAPLYDGETYQHEKIRIAYVSGDFFEHAVPFLIAGVLERHDRNRFEIAAISYGANDHSNTRSRLEAAVDRFIDVAGRPDSAIARLMHEMEIDIAIDLKGHTGRARPGIFACRPAPVQVNYLGYPGTMGAPYFDYLIADHILIPPEYRPFYSENIVYLPDTYQANDSARRIAPEPFRRSDLGLPEDAFVYCCFNGGQKILPGTFAMWMRILSAAKNSVLWLIENNEIASANLRSQAQLHGIQPARLIFAKHEKLDRHLARLRLADLVLDTLPYGAHTTASDALWAGVPVLSLMGNSFAGRVAASLLTAIGLPRLITRSPAEFEALALRLFLERKLLDEVREELARNRETRPLFDTERMTRNLERAYIEMWQRHRRREPPADMNIG